MDNDKLLVLRQDNVISKIFGFVKSLFKKIDGKMNDVMEDKKAKEEDVVLADTMFKMDETEESDDNSNIETVEKIQDDEEAKKKEFRKKYIKLYFQVRNGKLSTEELSLSDLFMINALFNSEIKLLKEKIDF
ncbi:MAG: hypothetical protein K6D97_02070 [Clostridia bacterium]|nr:hypothetical protein [Clostridia bacterium]